MKRLSAKIVYNKKWHMAVLLFMVALMTVVLTVADVYVAFGFVVTFETIILLLALLILRGSCLFAYAMTTIYSYHIFIRYRLLNKHLR